MGSKFEALVDNVGHERKMCITHGTWRAGLQLTLLCVRHNLNTNSWSVSSFYYRPWGKDVLYAVQCSAVERSLGIEIGKCEAS